MKLVNQGGILHYNYRFRFNHYHFSMNVGHFRIERWMPQLKFQELFRQLYLPEYGKDILDWENCLMI